MATGRYWPTGPPSVPGVFTWNVRTFRTFVINCAVINTPYSIQQQDQHLYAPDGLDILIKAHNFNNIASLILVATNAAECISAQSAYPLGAGETVQYAIQDGFDIWVSTNFAGSIAIISVEQA